MRPLASAAEAAALDLSTANSCSLPPLLLMENAAVRIWQSLKTRLPAISLSLGGKDPAIVALAGSGNNGGDALAVLRQARFEGHRDLAAILVSRRRGELVEVQLASLKAMGIPLISWEEERERSLSVLASASLLIDGITGTGLKGPLSGEALGLLRAIEMMYGALRPKIAAADMPSGLSDSMEPGSALLKADWTFSVEPAKASLYYPSSREAAGEIVPIDNVFPKDAFASSRTSLLEEADLPALAGSPKASAHKGERGRLGIFAGSRGMLGAAAFACHGAYAASAGLVTLFAEASIYPALSEGGGLAAFESAVIRPEPRCELGGAILDRAGFDSLHALVVGPGWGRTESHRILLSSLLEMGIPMILDADGARLFAELAAGGLKAKSPLVITPHPGEFEAISGIPAAEALANPPGKLSDFAARTGAIVVLKSSLTWLASPDGRLAVWDGREPSLGVAGSGDVLAGVMGGILAGKVARGRFEGNGPAAGEAAWEAAQAAVIAHGLSGRDARAKRGWYEARALAEEAARRLDPGLSFPVL